MNKTKLNRTAKILIATGATLLTSALFFGRKAKGASLNRHTLPPPDFSSSGHEKIITNHDKIYNYKYAGGIWHSRKKGTARWINLKAVLTPEKYNLAVSRLQKYI